MVTVPVLTPVTMPVLPTVAMDVLLLLHTPPGAASESVIVPAIHTVVGPLMVPALAAGVTVSVEVVKQLPMVYVMVTLPAVMPLTVPDAESIVATAVLLLA